MSERRFLEPAAKQRTAEVIRAVEAQTRVEVVVAVRRAASRHLATSLVFGLACALLGFAVMWLSPQVYDLRTMPLDAALSFVLGVGLVSSLAVLRRLLTPRAFLTASAERAAKFAFLALGIEKTRGRTGLLVYVALFERAIVLVPDSGVPDALSKGPLASIHEQLTRAVRRTDFEAFLLALAQLGPVCGAAMPRHADDENELCDEVA